MNYNLIHINSETNDMHLTIDGKILTEWEEKDPAKQRGFLFKG